MRFDPMDEDRGQFPGAAFVEVWWDRHVRSWVIQACDNTGADVDCDHTYRLEDAIQLADRYGVPIARTSAWGGRLVKDGGVANPSSRKADHQTKR